MIEMKHITKTYGDLTVFSDFSLEIPEEMCIRDSTTTMSSPPSTISGFSGQASARASKSRAGRILAKSSNSLRSPSKARSGRLSPGNVSHFQPPTAPKRTASAALQASTVACGRHSPTASMAQPPAKTGVRCV